MNLRDVYVGLHEFLHSLPHVVIVMVQDSIQFGNEGRGLRGCLRQVELLTLEMAADNGEAPCALLPCGRHIEMRFFWSDVSKRI